VGTLALCPRYERFRRWAVRIGEWAVFIGGFGRQTFWQSIPPVLIWALSSAFDELIYPFVVPDASTGRAKWAARAWSCRTVSLKNGLQLLV
jgi:hypothetical protein